MDTILAQLKHLEDELTLAWLKGNCQTCPLGELAALAAATRTFYEIHTRSEGMTEGHRPSEDPTTAHWSHAWQRDHGVY